MLGLIFLVAAIIFAIYSLKKEYFQDGPGIDLLQMIPRSVFRIVYVLRDIPNAQPRGMAIIEKVQKNQMTLDQALDQFYAIFMEGEAQYKAEVAKPYSSIFTDALDDILKEAMKDPNVNPLERAAVEQAVQKFKAKVRAQTAMAAGAAAPTTAPTLLGAALATPRGVADGGMPPVSTAATSAIPSAPAPTKDTYSQMRPALISDIRSAVKSELAASGIRPNADHLRVRTPGTVGLDTIGTNQGVDYDNLSIKGPVCQGDADASCPPEHNGCENGDMNDSCPAPIDMNKYIRKDSIPCWGCTLPTDY